MPGRASNPPQTTLGHEFNLSILHRNGRGRKEREGVCVPGTQVAWQSAVGGFALRAGSRMQGLVGQRTGLAYAAESPTAYGSGGWPTSFGGGGGDDRGRMAPPEDRDARPSRISLTPPGPKDLAHPAGRQNPVWGRFPIEMNRLIGHNAWIVVGAGTPGDPGLRSSPTLWTKGDEP